MDGNGHKPPIQFPGGSAIPIVGQPVTVKGFVPTVMLQCNCDAKEPMLAVGVGGLCRCPACQRTFRLQDILCRGGHVTVNVEFVGQEQPVLAGQEKTS